MATYYVEDCCDSTKYYVVRDDSAYWLCANGMCGCSDCTYNNEDECLCGTGGVWDGDNYYCEIGSDTGNSWNGYPCGVTVGDEITFYSADWNDYYCGTIIASPGSRTQVTHSSGNTFEGYENWTVAYVGYNGETAGCSACQSYNSIDPCPTNYIVRDCCDASIYYKVSDIYDSYSISTGDIIPWYGDGKYSSASYHCGTVVAEDCGACDSTGFTITDSSGTREISGDPENSCCECRKNNSTYGDNCEAKDGGGNNIGYTIIDCCDNTKTYTAKDSGGHGAGGYGPFCHGDALDFNDGNLSYCGTVDLNNIPTSAGGNQSINGDITNSASYGDPPTCGECQAYYCCSDGTSENQTDCENNGSTWECDSSTSFGGGCATGATTTPAPPTATFQWTTQGGVSVSENAGSIRIYVTRATNTSGTDTVNYATSDGTGSGGAVDGTDYTATSGTLTFGSGVTSGYIDVAIIDDSVYEGDKTFNVELTGATITGTNPQVVTILEDDVTTISFDAGTTNSASENAGTVTIYVSRDSSVGTNTVDYATSDGTGSDGAVDGTDYTATSGTLSWANGETQKSFTLSLANRSGYQGTRWLSIALSNATGSGTPQISGYLQTFSIDDDDSIEIYFVAATTDVNESQGSVTVYVDRSSDLGSNTVDYVTSDGTATAGSDYLLTQGTLSWAAGETSKSITITLLGDTTYEGNETFNITLSNPTGTATPQITGTNPHVVTIIENDEAPCSQCQTIFGADDSSVINDCVTWYQGPTNTSTPNGPHGTTFSGVNIDDSLYVDWKQHCNWGSWKQIVTGYDNNNNAVSGCATYNTSGCVNGDTGIQGPTTLTHTSWKHWSASISYYEIVIEIWVSGAYKVFRSATLNINNATPPAISFKNATSTVTETNATINHTVTLSRTNSSGWASVDVSTVDNTATSGNDYVALTNHTVSFPTGASETTFDVEIVGDILQESTETFNITLDAGSALWEYDASPCGSCASIDGSANSHTVTILNDDTANFTCNGNNVYISNAVALPNRAGTQGNVSNTNVDWAAASLWNNTSTQNTGANWDDTVIFEFVVDNQQDGYEFTFATCDSGTLGQPDPVTGGYHGWIDNGVNKEFDIWICLHDSGFNVIDTNDDYCNNAPPFERSDGYGAAIVSSTLSAGTYYLSVTGYSASGGGGNDVFPNKFQIGYSFNAPTTTTCAPMSFMILENGDCVCPCDPCAGTCTNPVCVNGMSSDLDGDWSLATVPAGYTGSNGTAGASTFNGKVLYKHTDSQSTPVTYYMYWNTGTTEWVINTEANFDTTSNLIAYSNWGTNAGNNEPDTDCPYGGITNAGEWTSPMSGSGPGTTSAGACGSSSTCCDHLGTCSDPQYTTQANCEEHSAIWNINTYYKGKKCDHNNGGNYDFASDPEGYYCLAPNSTGPGGIDPATIVAGSGTSGGARGTFACIADCPENTPNNWAIEITAINQQLPAGVNPLGQITAICTGTNSGQPCSCNNCGT